jgi:hypothetical protein
MPTRYTTEFQEGLYFLTLQVVGWVEFDEAKAEKLEMLDISGKAVIRILNPQSKEKIELSKFNDGIYLLRIKTMDGVMTTKVIKQ